MGTTSWTVAAVLFGLTLSGCGDSEPSPRAESTSTTATTAAPESTTTTVTTAAPESCCGESRANGREDPIFADLRG